MLWAAAHAWLPFELTAEQRLKDISLALDVPIGLTALQKLTK
jgi:hypothetical protein